MKEKLLECQKIDQAIIEWREESIEGNDFEDIESFYDLLSEDSLFGYRDFSWVRDTPSEYFDKHIYSQSCNMYVDENSLYVVREEYIEENYTTETILEYPFKYFNMTKEQIKDDLALEYKKRLIEKVEYCLNRSKIEHITVRDRIKEQENFIKELEVKLKTIKSYESKEKAN